MPTSPFHSSLMGLAEVARRSWDYTTALLPEFCAGAWCPLMLMLFGGSAVKVYGWEKESLQVERFRFFFFFHFSSSCTTERRRAFKQNVSNYYFSSIFSFLLFCFLSTISLVWLPGRICNGSIMVAWAFMSHPYPRLGEERGCSTGLGDFNLLFGH